MTVRDTLGDSCKELEMADNSKKAMKGIPLLARLDGRSFSHFTSGLKRPYDERMQKCMQETTKFLVLQFQPLIAYTQSDEISLVWLISDKSKTEFPFDGKFQKLTSVMAGATSSKFSRLAYEFLPEKNHITPCFDCRVWQVPTKETACDVFVWRELDCLKNSVSMAASTYYSPKDLEGKNSSERQELLFQKGINFNDYPAEFKRGSYFRRFVEEKQLTREEMNKIPENKRPESLTVPRSVIKRIDLPPIRKISNLEQVIFENQDPILIADIKDE